MTNIKEGIISIGGFELTPKTTRMEFEERFGASSYHSHGNPNPKTGESDMSYYTYEIGEYEIEKGNFYCRVTFADETLSFVELMPVLDSWKDSLALRGYAVERWIKYVQEAREHIEKWLRPFVGKPTLKNRDEVVYDFGPVTVAIQSKVKSHDNGRMEVIGGQLDIVYTQADDIPFFAEPDNQ